MSLLDFILWLVEFNQFSGIAGILYFLLFVRIWTSNVGIIFYVLLASITADVGNYFFIRFVYPNSFLIGNSWILMNYVLMTLLFYKLLLKKRRIVLSLFGVFAVGSIISFTSFVTFYESNTFTDVFTSLTFILLSLLVYFELLKSPEEKLSKSPMFWLVTGIFIYSSLTLLLGLFNQYLIFDLDISSEAYSIVLLINLLANIFKNLVLFYVIVLIDKGYPDSIPKPENS